MLAPVVDNALSLIGSTPLVRLHRLRPEGAAVIWAKAEHLNPGGSLKDRICLSMIEDAEATGALQAGMTIVESTSGNTGIGLALICAIKGYPLVLTMPASMSLERRQLLEAYGAEVILTNAEDGMEGAMAAAEDIARTQNAFMPRQFSNPANPRAHEEGTAIEILDALGRTPTALVAGVGTGGTIAGVGRVLREAGCEHIVAVEPQGSAVLSGASRGPSKIQGLGAGFVPPLYPEGLVDEVRTVSDESARAHQIRLAREEGLLVGISAGANVAVALEVAAELGPQADVVTFLCDVGERYFSLEEHFG